MVKLFGASWCAGCKSMKQTLDSIGANYEYVDIDSESGSELALKYKVRGLPTMVVQKGDEVEIVVGSKNKQFLLDLLGGSV